MGIYGDLSFRDRDRSLVELYREADRPFGDGLADSAVGDYLRDVAGVPPEFAWHEGWRLYEPAGGGATDVPLLFVPARHPASGATHSTAGTLPP